MEGPPIDGVAISLNKPESCARKTVPATGLREEKVETIASWGDFDVHFDGVLGRGGMGCVYRAWQRSVGRWVAVKVLNTPPSLDPELQQGHVLLGFQASRRQSDFVEHAPKLITWTRVVRTNPG